MSLAAQMDLLHNRDFGPVKGAHGGGRLHSTLGYPRPMDFERKWLAGQKRIEA